MTTWIVSRHKGALDWLSSQGLHSDKIVPHLDPDRVDSGDIVIGMLPINLAAEVCSRGARYLHLSLRTPYDWRGTELTAAQLQEIGAAIHEYTVQPRGKPHDGNRKELLHE